MPETTGSGWFSRRRALRAGGLLLLGCLVVLLVSWLSTRNDVSPEECRRLESLKNVAIGYLENGRFPQARLKEADEAFVEITQKLPYEPLGHRNLTITRLIALENKQATAEDTIAAAEQMLALESESVAARILAGQVFQAAGDAVRGADELTRARQLGAEDPAAAYAYYEAARYVPGLRDHARQALAQAQRLAPNNLYLLAMLLREQAGAEDTGIFGTLERASRAIEPIVASIREQTRTDPTELIAEASAAGRQGDRERMLQIGNRLANILLPAVATQIDMRRVKKDPLEYVLYDFGPRYCPRPPEPARTAEAPPAVSFKPLPAAGQPPETAGVNDVQLADFDLDGLVDVILLAGESLSVYSRVADGATWQAAAQIAVPPGYGKLIVADLDQDDPTDPNVREAQGDQQPPAAPPDAPGAADDTSPCQAADVDVVLFGQAGVLIYANQLAPDGEARTLEPRHQTGLENTPQVLALVAADVLHDGDLDLVVSATGGMSIWSNRGDMTFEEIGSRSALPGGQSKPTALAAVDLDRDVDLDIVAAAGASGSAGYLENLRHGQLRWRPLETNFDPLAPAGSLAILDADSNGSWDFAAAGKNGLGVVSTELSRAGVLTSRATEEVATASLGGIVPIDFDNDGLLDLVGWSGAHIEAFRGGPAGRWTPLPRLISGAPATIHAVAAGDIDEDGDLDLAVAGAQRLVLLENDGGNANHWLAIELRSGIADQQTRSFRVNHYGLGSLIEIRTGSVWQRRVVDGQKTHFGLNGSARPDVARVVWTNGVPQNLLRPEPDQVICEEQVLIGSCPYLYGWTGDRFEFVTDCLWAAPLGLQLAEGVLAPCREWEYLRIGADQLAPRDGEYLLRITEELWEALYLDQVRLIAVDHPDDVAVYSNEKVGPAEIAEFKVHTVRQARTPLAARDQRGRDVLEDLRRRDGTYLKAFDRRLGMGLAEEHSLELDLGKLVDPRQITLFLTGWIRPTGSSVNVGISGNPGLPPPKPPQLYVADADADGGWRLALPYMGFPGGKTKTIAVDLSQAFVKGDYRLRIVTNMEIYWDEAFFTVDEEPASFNLVPLDLTSAALRYRGFSRRTEHEQFGPEDYDYQDVTTQPKWPSMSGYFTRYGPVDDLLAEADDLLVVMGAGDELALTFAAPDREPPAGWTRDFLLYNVGWDKDADLNTVYGQQVEPLPFAGMSAYPYAAGEAYPSTDRHQQYLNTYQTRRQNPLHFWRLLADPSEPD